MEKIEAPEDEAATVKMRFPQPARSGLKTITLENVDQAYPGAPLLYKGLNFAAERGERIVLVGPNGAGKSTLLKILADVLPIQGGERIVGSNVRVGYHAQYRGDTMNLRNTILQEAQDIPLPVSEQGRARCWAIFCSAATTCSSRCRC